MRIYDNRAMKNRGLLDNDFNSPDNIAKRYRKIEGAFDMPKEEGWEPSDFGEKSFVKNKDKDNEMFIQYNGADYDGDNQEWVAGYMKDGGYVSKKFATMEDAKDFLSNIEKPKEGNDEEKHQRLTKAVGRFIEGQGSDQELDEMIKDLRKDYPDEEIIRKLAMMFKGTIK